MSLPTALEDLDVLPQHTLSPPERLHGLRAWPRACVRQRPYCASTGVNGERPALEGLVPAREISALHDNGSVVAACLGDIGDLKVAVLGYLC